MAVEVGRKIDALLLDLAQACQRKDLKSAGIGQNRAVPRHEFVQAAEIMHGLVARAQMEMIGIGKLDLTPYLFEVAR